MDDLLADLNPQQCSVVVHERGPLLVLAGPGSGKTRVITRHIAYRVRRGVAPADILAITFTNRAADEMRHRVSALIGEGPIPIGTFHWLCSSFLRRYIHRIGLKRDFRLLGPHEARVALRSTLPSSSRVADFASAISALKNGASVARASKTAGLSAASLTAARESYDRRLAAMNALDLDDLLAYTATILTDFPDVRERAAHFDAVLVDEFQDTNGVQAQIVALLAPTERTVIAVGDEDQAIYGWRGAGDGRRLFLEVFPDARIVALEQSYRHSKRVLRAASALIEHNERFPRALTTARPAGAAVRGFTSRDEAEEAEWVVEQIKKLAQGRLAYHEMAVLYRVNAQSRAIEDALIRAGIPYRVLAGLRFYERIEVRRALAYLLLALDPADETAALTLASGVSGVAEARIHVLQDRATEENVPLLDTFDLPFDPGHIPRAVQARLLEVCERARFVGEARKLSLMTAVDRAVESALADLQATADDLEAARENLEELRGVARDFARSRGTLRGFVDRLALQGDSSGTRSGVNLLSLHSAKGLEFSAVFLVGLEEGLLPHRRSLESDADVEAERRLAYVGMTRARDHLFLSYAQTRFLAGSALSGGASRFIREIGAANMEMRVSESAATRPRLSHVDRGERVRHTRWGEGTVLSVEGEGRRTLATIDFDNVGRQRLQLCYAPLSRATEGPAG